MSSDDRAKIIFAKSVGKKRYNGTAIGIEFRGATMLQLIALLQPRILQLE